jgi:hypothetical protein
MIDAPANRAICALDLLFASLCNESKKLSALSVVFTASVEGSQYSSDGKCVHNSSQKKTGFQGSLPTLSKPVASRYSGRHGDRAASLRARPVQPQRIEKLHSCALLLHQAPAHLAAARARERIAKNKWTTSAP